jgi:hypothetical protein
MEVILREDIEKLGQRGEVVKVAPGYARNFLLPKRLADVWFDLNGGSKPANMLSEREIEAVSAALHGWRLRPAGLEGYDKAEVTAGGVDTREISSKTFEARKAPGQSCALRYHSRCRRRVLSSPAGRLPWSRSP